MDIMQLMTLEYIGKPMDESSHIFTSLFNLL